MSIHTTEPVARPRHNIDDETFALEWTGIITNGGTVQDVADKLGMKKSYVQARSTALRKALASATPPFELPKARRETQEKDYDSLASRLNQAIAELNSDDVEVMQD